MYLDTNCLCRVVTFVSCFSGSVIKDKNGKLITDWKDVLKVWKEYFKELLNQRENSELELPGAVEGQVKLGEIWDAEVERERAMKKVKRCRATGIDEVRVEMLVMAERVGVRWTRRLLNSCMREGTIPEEWWTGLIVPVWKRKGDVHDPGKYRAITLLSCVLKMLERILDGRIRRIVECEMEEEQEGFRRGRGTAGGMFTLRQLVEKKLEGQENMALGFIDLKKAYDTVPRDMALATLRLMGVPETEVRMVEGTYEETKGRVVCGPGISEEFRVVVGLRQESALSPLLFIAVVEVINRKASTRDILHKLLYADDLAVVADSEADLQERLVDWKEIFGKHGLRVSLEKTEVLWVGQQKKDLDIRLDGKKLNQQDSSVYLGGVVCGDGSTKTDIRRRVQAGEVRGGKWKG